jgi:succinate dehydrogenase / fumarate reductase flavoprotein subunit
MEVGPTCHYVMGGVQVEPDTAAAVGVPGLFAAGEVAGGMHGSNRLGGNSLSDLLVFGRRAGIGAVAYLNDGNAKPKLSEATVAKAHARLNAPFERTGGENPYTIHQELQQTTNDLVGIIRIKSELEAALVKLQEFRTRIKNVTVTGGREFNPGFHLAFDLENMLIVSECIARSGLAREESRGGHTREDFPKMDPKWRQINLVCAANGDGTSSTAKPATMMSKELAGLFDPNELAKYFTDEELASVKGGSN